MCHDKCKRNDNDIAIIIIAQFAMIIIMAIVMTAQIGMSVIMAFVMTI